MKEEGRGREDLLGELETLRAENSAFRKVREEQERCEEERARLNTILEATPDFVSMADKEGRLTYINRAGRKILGIPGDDDVTHLTIADLHPASAFAMIRDVGIPGAINQGLWKGETVLLSQGGREAPVSQVIICHRAPDGGCDYLSMVAREITEIKEAEKALRESEERYRTFIDSTADMAFLKDEQFRHVIANKALLDYFGLREDQVIGKTDFELMPEEAANGCRASDISAMTSGIIFRDEEPQGSRFYETRKFPVRLAHGRTGIGGYIRDVTEQKRAEGALQASEARFRAFAETTTAATFVVQGAKFCYVNPAFELMSGYGMGDLERVKLWDVIHPDFHELIRGTGIAGQGGREVPTHHECKIICKNGEERWVDFAATVFQFENLPAILGSAADITERKRLQEQLLHAQKMDAVGQLAGGIAHDFNNIITAIIGYVHLLNIRDDDDPRRTYAGQILSVAERAANVTQSLLAFSRKQIIAPRPVNINRIVGDMKKLLARLIGEDIELTTRLFERDLTIYVDVGQLEQMLMNLATNAMGAMPRGGALTVVTEIAEMDEEFVRTHGYGKPGTYVLLTVSDTGMGMDQETQKRIFEPFFTTKDVGKGTGLGLSIVYGIVTQHEGFINCYSEPGKGTTFRIYFPLVARLEDRDVEPRSMVNAPKGTETVLFAEDERSVREALRDSLQGFGYTVIEAADGLEAETKFAEFRDRIDLVVLDVVMPKKNGKEAYQGIQRLKPGVKTLFMSGYTADILHRKGILEEGLQFLPKPVSPFQLLHKIREMLDK